MRTLRVCEVEAVAGGFVDNNGNGIDDRYEEGYQEPASYPIAFPDSDGVTFTVFFGGRNIDDSMLMTRWLL